MSTGIVIYISTIETITAVVGNGTRKTTMTAINYTAHIIGNTTKTTTTTTAAAAVSFAAAVATFSTSPVVVPDIDIDISF